MTSIKQIAAEYGISVREIARRFGIPYRTAENWAAGVSKPPAYVLTMIEILLNRERR